MQRASTTPVAVERRLAFVGDASKLLRNGIVNTP